MIGIMGDKAREPRAGTPRGFTLVEVLVATVLTALIVGAVSGSIAQFSRAKTGSRIRLQAYLRAEAALSALRSDLASVVRTDDLFYTRLALYDESVRTPWGEIDRDEILVFNTRLRPIRDVDSFSGEGIEYETQYRVDEGEEGPVLWRRRDAQFDEWEFAGGVASPLVEGIVGVKIEAYDGDSWYDEWDSDERGLPTAMRITVSASGYRPGDDVYETLPAVLRTVVAIDRVLPPRDRLEDEERQRIEDEAEAAAEQAAEEGGGALGGAPGEEVGRGGDGGTGGGGAGGGRGGGGRGGGGGGGGGQPGGGGGRRPPPAGGGGGGGSGGTGGSGGGGGGDPGGGGLGGGDD
jgi:prepilin-type N-terminal cleavage/methylation domain-containing protein